MLQSKRMLSIKFKNRLTVELQHCLLTKRKVALWWFKTNPHWDRIAAYSWRESVTERYTQSINSQILIKIRKMLTVVTAQKQYYRTIRDNLLTHTTVTISNHMLMILSKKWEKPEAHSLVCLILRWLHLLTCSLCIVEMLQKCKTKIATNV